MLLCTVHIDDREFESDGTENAVGLFDLSSNILRKRRPLSVVTTGYLSSLVACRMQLITFRESCNTIPDWLTLGVRPCT